MILFCSSTTRAVSVDRERKVGSSSLDPCRPLMTTRSLGSCVSGDVLDRDVPGRTPSWVRDLHRGCETYSLETGAGLQRYSHGDQLDPVDVRAAFDGSTLYGVA